VSLALPPAAAPVAWEPARGRGASLAGAALALATVVVALATCAALFVGEGSPGAVAAPVLVAALGFAVWKLPLRVSVFGLFALVVFTSNPQERPAAGEWEPPLHPLASLLFENLNKATGIGALRVAAIDLAIVGLALLALRRASQPGRDGTALPAPSVLRRAMAISLAGVLLAEASGLLRHGDARNSLWQVRQLAAVPVMALVFLQVLRGPADLKRLGVLVVAATFAKTLEGLWVRFVVCDHADPPPYVTTHSDSMLFVAALLMVLVFWHEVGTRRSFWLMLGVGSVATAAIVLNNRRLAWVALAAALATIYWLLPRTRFTRSAARAAVLLLPVAILYTVAGLSSQSAVFKPVHMVVSVVVGSKDRSTQTRDIENWNLVHTLKANPMLGTGFGHPYAEFSRADDISRLFQQYKFIPHNSLLGLWAFGGLVGFTAFWLPLVVSAFLAARAFRRSRVPLERAAALVSIGVLIGYSIQAYGDMGLQSWESTFLLSAAMATAGRLAMDSGGWTERTAGALTPDPSPHGPRCGSPIPPQCGPVERGESASIRANEWQSIRRPATNRDAAAHPSPPGRTAVEQAGTSGPVWRGDGGEGRANGRESQRGMQS